MTWMASDAAVILVIGICNVTSFMGNAGLILNQAQAVDYPAAFFEQTLGGESTLLGLYSEVHPCLLLVGVEQRGWFCHSTRGE